MYEISTETFDLRPGDGVDQVCQLLIELAADKRPMERITIFENRVEVRRYRNPDDALNVLESEPTSIENMLRSVEMQEMVLDGPQDALRLAYQMCRHLESTHARPISWVVGDLDVLNQGLKSWGRGFVTSPVRPQLFGLPVRVSAELGQDRIVLVGGASRHHNPERATQAVSAIMQWQGEEK